MTTVFVSYRRDDSAGYTGRLIDGLVQKFGNSGIFRDIDDIEPGSDFVEAIGKAVGACDILIAVIGTQWLSISDARGRPRIADPNDFVRVEVATALARNVRVIPVLVRGAQMPPEADLPEDLKPLARRNAVELSDVRWDFDVGRLMEALDRFAPSPDARRSPQSAPVARAAAAADDGAPGGCLEALVWGTAVLAPIVGSSVGIIVGLIMLGKASPAKRSAGKRWLIGAALIGVLWLFILAALGDL